MLNDVTIFINFYAENCNFIKLYNFLITRITIKYFLSFDNNDSKCQCFRILSGDVNIFESKKSFGKCIRKLNEFLWICKMFAPCLIHFYFVTINCLGKPNFM